MQFHKCLNITCMEASKVLQFLKCLNIKLVEVYKSDAIPCVCCYNVEITTSTKLQNHANYNIKCTLNTWDGSVDTLDDNKSIDFSLVFFLSF